MDGRPFSDPRSNVVELDLFGPAFSTAFAELPPQLKLPALRSEFWDNYAGRTLYGQRALEVLTNYRTLAEQHIASIVGQHCLSYWLNLYRRVPVKSSGATTVWAWHTRCTVETAFRKYAMTELCTGVAPASRLLPSSILGGRFARTAPSELVRALCLTDRIVLTSLSVGQLEQLFQLERLAWDIHHAGIILRNLFWGAGVTGTGDERGFRMLSTPYLKRAASAFDSKLGALDASYTGTVVGIGGSDSDGGILAAHNFTDDFLAGFESLISAFAGRRIRASRPPQFVWFPFSLDAYYESHKSFEEAFLAQHNVTLVAVLRSLACLYYHAVRRWSAHLQHVGQHWHLGFEDGVDEQQIIRTVVEGNNSGAFLANLPRSTECELEAAVRYLTLTAEKQGIIDTLLKGPVFPVIRQGGGRVVDYAWPSLLLEKLFINVNPSDQRFKGPALERIVVGQVGAFLPTAECRSTDGTSRQVDASFVEGDVLVIVECKAIGRSLGIDRGDLKAQRFRLTKLREAIREVDAKADWLATRPEGRNYSIPCNVTAICPLVVSPFQEFLPLPSKEFKLNDTAIRVVTPAGLDELRASRTLNRHDNYNLRQIVR